MKYFIVPAALMLAACALPGTSGMGSFMTAMHPSQDFCASHGMTLDATTKQCVTPPSSKETETTGSLTVQPAKTEPPASPPAHQVSPQAKTQQARTEPPQTPQAQQQPPQAQPQQPPPQEKQAALSAPIEPDAVIRPDSPHIAETAVEFVHFVRASGYRCDSISALTPRPGGFTLACNRSTFRYAIEGRGDGWIVTVQ